MLSPSTDAGRPAWPSTDGGVRWGVGAAIGCFLGAQVLAGLWATVVIVTMFDDGLPGLADRPLWALPVLGIGLWVGYLAGPVMINRLTNSGPMVDFDLRGTPAQFGVAAAAGVATQLLVLPALYWVVLNLVSGDPGDTAETLIDQVDGPLDVILLVFAVVIMAPLAEEWFYRGMLLSALVRRIGPIPGAVATSAVFAVVHQEAILLPGLFTFALVLAWLTLRTGKIGVAVVAHMAFNATTVVQLLIFGS